jgi:hypothetical protein
VERVGRELILVIMRSIPVSIPYKIFPFDKRNVEYYSTYTGLYQPAPKPRGGQTKTVENA